MGIVIAVIMLLGLIALVRTDKVNKFVGFALLAGGLWNALWFGLRHIGSFWGNASIVTGLLMVLAAMHLLAIFKLPQGLRKLTAFGLTVGFLLYTITIVQLNLGYPIIG